MKPLGYHLSSILVLSVAVALTHARAQERGSQERDGFGVRLQAPAMSFLWDDVRKELVTSASWRNRRDKNTSSPMVVAYDMTSGETHFIDILRDFPGAEYVNVNGIAISPDGSVLVACDLGFPDAIREGNWDRLLLYDEHSGLTRNLDAYPYDVTAVAMDQQGNIYVLGIHTSERSSEESYPLIVKYDAFGHTTQGMLPRSLFSEFDDPTRLDLGWNAAFSVAALSVDEETVRAYLPTVGEVIVLDHDGNIQKRINVAEKLSALARAGGYQGFAVDESRFSPSGDLWLEGFLGNPRYRGDARDFMVRVTETGKLEAPYPQDIGNEPTSHIPRLIGFTQSNEPVAYSEDGSPNVILIQKNPY